MSVIASILSILISWFRGHRRETGIMRPGPLTDTVTLLEKTLALCFSGVVD